MEFPIIQTLVRLLVPLLIFRLPLVGVLLSILVDMYDWQFVDHSTAEKLAFYQNWDKTLDLYYQIFIVFIALRFKDIIAKRTAIILFSYRMIGLFLFYFTHNRLFLFLFPNVFENFVVLYLLYVFISKQKIMFKNKKILITILLVLIIPKTIHEYFHHYLIKMPWEVYDVGTYIQTTGVVREYVNYLSFGIVLYVIPILVAVFILKTKLSKQ